MKSIIRSALLVASVAGCSSKPLTETECQTRASKEIDFAVSKAPRGEGEGPRAFLGKHADKNIPQYMAEKTYSRSDYRCMAKASDSASIGKCIYVINERQNISRWPTSSV